MSVDLYVMKGCVWLCLDETKGCASGGYDLVVFGIGHGQSLSRGIPGVRGWDLVVHSRSGILVVAGIEYGPRPRGCTWGQWL